jgi:ParB/RepB/Spo0J family partition protein
MLDGYKVVDAVYDIQMIEIYNDPTFNCRGFFTAESVQDLASSIRDNGLIEPIVLQPIDELPTRMLKVTLDQKWRLIAGHRRLAAVHLFLRWEHIQARVIRGLTTEQAQTVNFIENLDRQDLNILQEAQAIDRVWPDLAERPLAARLKRHPRWIRTRRRLIKMSHEIQQAAASGRIKGQDIEFIGRANDPAEQHRLFQGILDTRAKKRKEGPRHKGVEWNAANSRTRAKPDIGSMMTHIMEQGVEQGRDVEPLTSILAWTMRGISAKELLTRLDLPLGDQRYD